ncbi:glycosyltransferase family 4 protein [Steroidobacter flavus]|uniref:Glycosyltransferase family 4 protein n=1 Tax=Steroidobacter flavus TaxID=1842136 RepID=A0ABV8SZC2_9GAMM
MLRRKVLVFVVADLVNQHGGNLWLQSLFHVLSMMDELEITVVTSGRKQASEGNECVVRGFGFNHIFVPLGVPLPEATPSLISRVLGACCDKYYFNLERWARRQASVDSTLSGIAQTYRPDLILVSDIWSAMCCPSLFEECAPCCLITLNDEVRFHRASRMIAGPVESGFSSSLERAIHRNWNWIANFRHERYTDALWKKCAGVVALTTSDLPPNLPRHTVKAVLPPLLKEREVRWRYSAARSLLFVGNIWHFPNRLALKWLCTSLSPALLSIDNSIVINIIGCDREQWPGSDDLQNVRFLGRGSYRDVIHHMTTDDMFVAPIENAYGAKLKLVECASMGMPFVATDSAMSGLPFIKCVPRFELDSPTETAKTIAEMLDTPAVLLNMSREIITEMSEARIEQAKSWKRFLGDAMAARIV